MPMKATPNATFQALDFTLETPAGPRHAVVLAEVLETLLGCEPKPAAWVKCFEAHRDQIVAWAVGLASDREVGPVVLTVKRVRRLGGGA